MTRYTWIDGSDLRFHKQIHAKTTLGLFTKYNFFPLLKTGFLFVASTEFPGALLCKLSSWFLASGSGGRHHTAWIALHSWPYKTVMPKAGGMSWTWQPSVQQQKCSITHRTKETHWLFFFWKIRIYNTQITQMVFILLSKLSLLFLIFMFIGALPECMYIYVQVWYALKL